MENRNLTVLAIDDNPDNLTVLKAVVSDRLPGTRILTALSGPTGIELARTEDPDVILLDIVMPGMDGYEVCRKLKSDPVLQVIPVLFVTALKTDIDSRVAALETGADGFLPKPFDAAELMAQIRAMGKIKAAALLRRNNTERLAAMVTERTQVLQQSQTAMLNVMEDLRTENAERKRAEKVVLERNEELKAVYDHAPVMICVVDSELRVRYANPAFATFAGAPEATLKGGRACGVFGCLNAKDDPRGCGFGPKCSQCAVQRAMESTLRTGIGQKDVEHRSLWLSGSDRREATLMGSTSLIHVDGQSHVLLCMHDITERKRAQDEKERLQAQLSQAQKMESVGRLAGGVAHDFNNMLGVILGHAELALDVAPEGHPLHTALVEIQAAATRSAELTRQLLAFARKQTIVPRALDLNDTVASMHSMLAKIIGENLELEWLPGRDLWHVLMDPCQIDNILINLCVNARDAISSFGKVSVETANATFDEAFCANHTGYLPGEFVLLAVTDNGCGMSAETLDRLFEPFFTTKPTGKGTGLGLATVYGTVQQNNGFIIVRSAPGAGTTFKIHLPRHRAKAEELRRAAPPDPLVPGTGTILLVEDEASILRMTTVLLEHQGYTVIPAASPGEAIRLAQTYPGTIHLLMTDVVMPEMNGRDLAKALLAMYPDLRRLFMSGYTADVIAHHGVLDAGIHFIQKPFSRKDLALKLREAMA